MLKYKHEAEKMPDIWKDMQILYNKKSRGKKFEDKNRKNTLPLKNYEKEKNTLIQIKLNDVTLPIQDDTDCEAMIIPKNIYIYIYIYRERERDV